MVTMSGAVLVTGCTGIVGGGIVEACLNEGLSVVAVTRSKEKGESFKRELMSNGVQNIEEKLFIIPGIDGTRSGILKLANIIKDDEIHVSHVVSCFGGSFGRGTFSELSQDDIDESVARSKPHVHMMHIIWPLVKGTKGSTFTFIDGMLGERCHMPHVAGLSISNSFLYGCILAFQAENTSCNTRINEIRIGAMLRKATSENHPFLKSAENSFPSTLIGLELLNIVRQEGIDRQIIRITSEDLKNKLLV